MKTAPLYEIIYLYNLIENCDRSCLYVLIYKCSFYDKPKCRRSLENALKSHYYYLFIITVKFRT